MMVAIGKFYLYSLGSFGDLTTFANLSAITDSNEPRLQLVGTSFERELAILHVLRQHRRRN